MVEIFIGGLVLLAIKVEFVGVNIVTIYLVRIWVGVLVMGVYEGIVCFDDIYIGVVRSVECEDIICVHVCIVGVVGVVRLLRIVVYVLVIEVWFIESIKNNVFVYLVILIVDQVIGILLWYSLWEGLWVDIVGIIIRDLEVWIHFSLSWVVGVPFDVYDVSGVVIGLLDWVDVIWIGDYIVGIEGLVIGILVVVVVIIGVDGVLVLLALGRIEVLDCLIGIGVVVIIISKVEDIFIVIGDQIRVIFYII